MADEPKGNLDTVIAGLNAALDLLKKEPRTDDPISGAKIEFTTENGNPNRIRSVDVRVNYALKAGQYGVGRWVVKGSVNYFLEYDASSNTWKRI